MSHTDISAPPPNYQVMMQWTQLEPGRWACDVVVMTDNGVTKLSPSIHDWTFVIVDEDWTFKEVDEGEEDDDE